MPERTRRPMPNLASLTKRAGWFEVMNAMNQGPEENRNKGIFLLKRIIVFA
ncbi:MAG: hypothetical protein NUV57_06510 [archaeon]|nr:hypothetical protein [archaeon]